MTRVVLFSVFISLFSLPAVYAETPAETPSEPAVVTEPAQDPAAETVAEDPAASNETEPAESFDAQNLEFVSGEVSALDEASKSLTIKLYGETEESASDKLLTVQVEQTTDITDGEKDREMKSLAVGTEVDVEYDPATKKATYIFVY